MAMMMKAFLNRFNRGKDKDTSSVPQPQPTLPRRSLLASFKPLPGVSSQPRSPYRAVPGKPRDVVPFPSRSHQSLPASRPPSSSVPSPDNHVEGDDRDRRGSMASVLEMMSLSLRTPDTSISTDVGSAQLRLAVTPTDDPPNPDNPEPFASSSRETFPLRKSVSRVQATQGEQSRGSTSAPSHTDVVPQLQTSHIVTPPVLTTAGASRPVCAFSNNRIALEKTRPPR
ncbi:hypothetical protein BJ138DRAFT_1184671 [Hygrophoropsis aurantiaca]|uniref:Uncharacterized protein n=1 Tax=Hygrophoropsis aurantiaca TaxID=72124 RepID=A0ACB7ZNU2_9AGAM|nr:hypothetical protein BJ138DRAFT_1184671 [Hygrophoropsis aurantiaca]